MSYLTVISARRIVNETSLKVNAMHVEKRSTHINEGNIKTEMKTNSIRVCHNFKREYHLAVTSDVRRFHTMHADKDELDYWTNLRHSSEI